MKLKILLLTMLMIFTASCNKQKGKLYIYNWSSYILEDLIKEFEQKNDCQVVYDVFSSNEEMYAKIKAGGGGYDIAFPSSYYAENMLRENMLEQIDTSKIPNLANVDKTIQSKIDFDKEGKYFIPYMSGATGLAVNKKYLKNYKKSWSLFDRADLNGRMTLLDDIRDTMGAALVYLGYSPNSVNPVEINKAKEVVARWKKNIVKFDSETFAKGVVNGDFWVVQGYAENIYPQMEEAYYANIDYFVPDEGGVLWSDGMVILKGSKNIDLAYKFIDFIHDAQVMAKNSDFLHSCPANSASDKYKKIQCPYDRSKFAKYELLKDVGENIELYNKAWQEIRVGK
jgi:spermidine/putrescine transport system substrate-binding protein